MQEIDIKLSQGNTHCRVNDQGNGEWVVLVHGLITPQFAWHFLFEDLVKSGYRVVSFDLYGRGESDIPQIEYNFDLYIQQLDEIIHYFCKTKKPNIVAWSMGGALSSLYAMKHTQRINKLVLIAPGIVIAAGHWMKQLLQHNLASALFIKTGKMTLEDRMQQQFTKPNNYQEYYKKATAQTKRQGFWESLVSIIVNYPENLLKILHYYPEESPKPLIIWGKDDKITDYAESKEVTRKLGGELLTIPNASHAVHYEHPNQVNQAIINFLKTKKKS